MESLFTYATDSAGDRSQPNSLPTQLAGMPVYIDDLLGWEQERKQVKFPRSKKRRIQNKWAKQEQYFRVRKWQEPKAYRVGHMLVMNSAAMAGLKSQTTRREG